MSGQHVLVTGAAGFIGSHLARRLRAEGHRVVGVDAYRGEVTPAIAARRLADLRDDPGFDLVELDVVGDEIDRVTARASALFHFAGRPGARESDGRELMRDNVLATARIVATAAAAGVPHIVFASTSAVYGAAGERGACGERDAVMPRSPYGRTKRAGELLCLQEGIRSTVVRLFTVYGPHQRADMAFSRFIESSLTGVAAPLYQPAGAARDYTYVSDAVDGIVRAWRHGTAPIYNIAGGQIMNLASACRIIEELAGARVTTYEAPAPFQPSATRADLSIARRDLGYRPAVGLRAGLGMQLAAMLSGRPLAAAASPA